MSLLSRRRFLLGVISLGAFLFTSGWSTASDKASQPRRSSDSIAVGTEWETPYYRIETGKPGPTVMIVGGVHGNEPGGWQAAEQIASWELSRGSLLVVPRANILRDAGVPAHAPGTRRP